MKKFGPDAGFIDDLARMAGGAVNVMSGLQQQIQEDIRSRVDQMAARLDLVPREDLERAEARIAKLEKQVAALMTATAPKAAATSPKTAAAPAKSAGATKKPSGKAKS